MAYSSRLELQIDSRGAERNLRRVEGGLDRVDRAGDRADDSIQGLGSSLGGLRTIAMAAGGALAAMGIGQFARDNFAAIQSSQQLRASLKTVTGSAEAATAAWENLLQFAAETPFTLEQSVQGFIRMKSLGLDPTNEALRSFGNTASAMGKDMMQMVEAVADATTGEFERLKEFGIRASKEGDQITFTFQGVETTVRNSSEAISEYLQGIGENQFAGAMADQMDTLGGKASNLEDSIYQLYLAIGEAGATDAFNAALDGSISATEYLTENLDDVAQAASGLAVVAGGRLAGSLGAATAAKLAATQQSIAYQAALARMAGVSRTAAAAQTSLAAATRAASGALALVGGPLGLLVGGAGLLYVFRDELNLTGQRLGLTEQQAKNFRDELDDMSNQDMSGSLDSLNTELQQATLNAARAREELAQLRSENSGSGALGFGGGVTGERIRGIRAVAEAEADIAEIEQKRNMARVDLWGRWADQVANVTAATDKNASSVTVQSEATKEAAKAAKEAARQAEQFGSSLQSLEDRLFPVEAAQRQFRQEQIMLQTALMQGKIGIERYLEAWQRLQEAQLSQQDPSQAYGGQGFGSQIGQGGLGGMQQRGSQWDRWLESAQNAFTDFDAMAANTAESFQSGFGQAFESMIFDSQNFGDAMYNLMDGIARTLVRSLGEMAAQWLAYQAVQQMVGKSTASMQSAGMISRAAAKQQEAALNAYASTAAIPVVGPALAPAAAGTAMASTAPFVAAISSLSASGVIGQAHDGWDSLPRSGTYNLEKGERVTSASLNRDLTRFLDRENKSASNQERRPSVSGSTNVTIHNNGRPMRVESAREREQDGERFIDLVVADIQSEGRTHDAMTQKYNLSSQGHI